LAEILILGCGRNIQHVDPELRRFIRSTGMKLEAVDSVSIYLIGKTHFIFFLSISFRSCLTKLVPSIKQFIIQTWWYKWLVKILILIYYLETNLH